MALQNVVVPKEILLNAGAACFYNIREQHVNCFTLEYSPKSREMFDADWHFDAQHAVCLKSIDNFNVTWSSDQGKSNISDSASKNAQNEIKSF